MRSSVRQIDTPDLIQNKMDQVTEADGDRLVVVNQVHAGITDEIPDQPRNHSSGDAVKHPSVNIGGLENRSQSEPDQQIHRSTEQDHLLNTESVDLQAAEDKHRDHSGSKTDRFSRWNSAVTIEIGHDSSDGTKPASECTGSEWQVVLSPSPRGIRDAGSGTDSNMDLKPRHWRPCPSQTDNPRSSIPHRIHAAAERYLAQADRSRRSVHGETDGVQSFLGGHRKPSMRGATVLEGFGVLEVADSKIGI